MKIKTAELTGLALDWALADAMQIEKLKLVEGRPVYMPSCGGRKPFDHTDPATCMGLIVAEFLQVIPTIVMSVDLWGCHKVRNKALGGTVSGFGATLAEAVARCVVAMRLGDEVEVPDELCGVQS